MNLLTIEYINDCIEKSNRLESKVPSDVLDIQGWSSQKIKHLLNNLCSNQDAKFLEVGVWKGSTHISALYGNNIPSCAIDNFSGHWDNVGHPFESEDGSVEKLEFNSNCEKFLGSTVQLIDLDFKDAIKSLKANSFNILFYDGDHEIESQYEAVALGTRVMTKEFLLLVDDWNWDKVQEGTKKALQNKKLNVLHQWELPAFKVGDYDEWWNGLAIFLIQKVQKNV